MSLTASQEAQLEQIERDVKKIEGAAMVRGNEILIDASAQADLVHASAACLKEHATAF